MCGQAHYGGIHFGCRASRRSGLAQREFRLAVVGDCGEGDAGVVAESAEPVSIHGFRQPVCAGVDGLHGAIAGADDIAVEGERDAVELVGRGLTAVSYTHLTLPTI